MGRLLETFRIGIEVGLGLDDGDIDQVMRAVIARASRHVGNRIIACMEQYEAHRSDDLWVNLIRDGRIKLIGINENGKNIYQAI